MWMDEWIFLALFIIIHERALPPPVSFKIQLSLSHKSGGMIVVYLSVGFAGGGAAVDMENLWIISHRVSVINYGRGKRSNKN
jgi:hypothetical protein